MAKPIIVANWKDRPASAGEARMLLAQIGKRRELLKRTTLFIAPPSPYLLLTQEKASGFSRLAVQNIEILPSGRHTGTLSVEMLKNFGVKLSILGHSERRALGETDEEVSRKVGLALKSGITPLICVGEQARDSEGLYLEEISISLRASLKGVKKKEAEKIVIAYEPVWAIGKRAQDSMSPEDLREMILFLRRILSDMYDRKIAQKIVLLYGGSVEPANAEALYHSSDISGFLVGHASLDAEKFIKIAEAIIK